MVADLEEPPLSEPESPALSEVPQAAAENSMATLKAAAAMVFSLLNCMISLFFSVEPPYSDYQQSGINIHYSVYIYKCSRWEAAA